jgi:hypothetical protein
MPFGHPLKIISVLNNEQILELIYIHPPMIASHSLWSFEKQTAAQFSRGITNLGPAVSNTLPLCRSITKISARRPIPSNPPTMNANPSAHPSEWAIE